MQAVFCLHTLNTLLRGKASERYILYIYEQVSLIKLTYLRKVKNMIELQPKLLVLGPHYRVQLQNKTTPIYYVFNFASNIQQRISHSTLQLIYNENKFVCKLFATLLYFGKFTMGYSISPKFVFFFKYKIGLSLTSVSLDRR